MAHSDNDILQTFLVIRPQIQRFLNQRLRCTDTAADLLQDIYLRLIRLEPPPRNEGEARAWLFAVASNLSIDHLRSQKRRIELLDRYLGDTHEADDTEEPERIATAHDQWQQLQNALAELPDQCAEILYLSRIEGCNHREIAQRLGISVSWVEKQLTRALQHCRANVELEQP